MSGSRSSGVVLAAGRSSRAGCIKANAIFEGRTFLQRTIDMLRQGGCDSVVVVVGPPHQDAIRDTHPDVRFACNEDPDRGMLSSLQTGLAAVADGDVVIALVDQPRISAATVAALIAAKPCSSAAWLRPTHQGRSGHPYLIRAAARRVIREADVTQSARDVLRAMRCESVTVDDPHVLEDIDTAAELARLHKHSPRRKQRP